jgi:PEP-CTERM motif
MKMARFLLIALVVGFAAVAAKADGVDPKITIGGGGSCDARSITSETQSFTNLSTGCQIDFSNDISSGDNEFGVTLWKLVVNVTSGFTGTLSCAALEGSIFTVDSEATTANSCTYVTDSGFHNGGAPISLQFDNDPAGGGGFTGACTDNSTNSLTCVDVTIAQNVINTPEPASAVLLLAGAGALAAFRKRRRTA